MESSYIFEIADRRLFSNIAVAAAGTDSTGAPVSYIPRSYTSTAVSRTIQGRTLSLKALNSTSLFGANTKLLTTLTIEGSDSGARTTVPVEISKQVIASTSPQGQTGIMLR